MLSRELETAQFSGLNEGRYSVDAVDSGAHGVKFVRNVRNCGLFIAQPNFSSQGAAVRPLVNGPDPIGELRSAGQRLKAISTVETDLSNNPETRGARRLS